MTIRLSPRERQILDLLAEGVDRHAIAASLYVSHSTIKTHMTSLYAKLGATNAASAIHNAHLLGLLGMAVMTPAQKLAYATELLNDPAVALALLAEREQVRP